MKSSSFQRKVKSRLPPIAGCYPSIYTHHLLVSTGVPDLDQLLGGGLPIGTILLLEEDFSGSIGKLLLKYYLSEGVVHKHSLFLSSLTQSPESILHNLPSIVDGKDALPETSTGDSTSGKENTTGGNTNEQDHMKIAWRYKNNSSQAHRDSDDSKHSFNLLLPIQQDRLKQCSIETCNPITSDESGACGSVRLLKELAKHCKDNGYLVETPNKDDSRRILRIGVHSLGDILWGESPTQILTFLLALKALLRACYGVALVTVPPSLHENEELRLKLRSCVDFVVKLNSFDADETVNPAYKDYHGIICAERMSCLGVLTPPLHLLKENVELVYKSRRNRFLIEKFHLPPDLSETVSRDTKDPKLKKNIDF